MSLKWDSFLLWLNKGMSLLVLSGFHFYNSNDNFWNGILELHHLCMAWYPYLHVHVYMKARPFEACMQGLLFILWHSVTRIRSIFEVSILGVTIPNTTHRRRFCASSDEWVQGMRYDDSYTTHRRRFFASSSDEWVEGIHCDDSSIVEEKRKFVQDGRLWE